MVDLVNSNDHLGGHNYIKLFSQAPAPIAIYRGRELRYVFINDAYSKIFGHREILGKTIREAFPELEGQPYFGILENVYDTGNPFYGNETPALIDVKNDGVLTTRYYNLVYTPYRNDDGGIDGVMAFGHDVTDQVEARQKERESDLRFRNIVEQSRDPILILKGRDLVLDVANEALLDLWNIDTNSIGKPFVEILPEMKDQGFHDLLLDVYENGSTHYGQEAEVYFKRPNEEKRSHFFNFSYQPYYEADQNIAGVLVLATDVTEQVITKRNLAQSEINFQNMVLQAPVAMCVLEGADFVLIIANERMYRLWGDGSANLAGMPVFEAFPQAKEQGLEEVLSHVYTKGESFAANERPWQVIRGGRKETTYINFVYEPLRAGNGKIKGIICVATDVTEQVIARKKIELAEESARLAIDSADLGTYEINLLTNKVVTSARFKQIWGFDFEHGKRNDYATVIHPDDLSVREKALKESITTGNLDYEARVIWKDGSVRWVKVKGKHIHNEEEVPVRLLGVIQDITEQKLFAEELFRQVEERTIAFQDVKRQLEKSNEELEQFAYIASHDLQEPLRKMHLFSSMAMEEAELTGNAKTYISKVSAAASRMSGLIRDLLEYSRLAQRNAPFEETNLDKILQLVLTDYELLITQKEAIIKFDSLPTIEAIPLQMNQLIFNLLGNALKFTRKNLSPLITITSTKVTVERKRDFPQLAAHKEYVEIRIRDNGIGFHPEYAEKIFTIFQRLNEKSMFRGYGIGLALCRKIIDNHSGIIYAEGKPKEGASFIFILPYIQGQ